MLIEDTTPAWNYGFDDLAVGLTVEQVVTFSQCDVELFGELVGDRAAVHFDALHARSMGYSAPIVHGLLISSRFSRLMGMFLPGPLSVIQGLKLSFTQPVSVGVPVNFRVRVKSCSPAVRAVILEMSAEVNGSTAVSAIGTCTFPTQKNL